MLSLYVTNRDKRFKKISAWKYTERGVSYRKVNRALIL